MVEHFWSRVGHTLNSIGQCQQNEAALHNFLPSSLRSSSSINHRHPFFCPLFFSLLLKHLIAVRLSTLYRAAYFFYFPQFLIRFNQVSAFEISCPSPVLTVFPAIMSSISLIDSVIDDDDEFWYVLKLIQPARSVY